jgi:glutamate/tyrosine decarboxylase-like PLP-dependent enzyme
MTSGGTESIIMAVKTYRDWARATKGITEPEMSVCDSGRATVISYSLQDRSRVRPRCVRQGSGVPED